jgi:hypothetical protein
MYSDKDKQREAVREAVRRHRAKGITKVLHKETPVPVIPVTPKVTPRSIGIVPDRKAEMMRKFLEGVK